MEGAVIPWAPTGDILIKSYKEKEHISKIHEVINEWITRSCGVHFAYRWKSLIEHVLPCLIYHLPAWFMDLPTIDEESAEVWEYPFERKSRLLRMVIRLLLVYVPTSCFLPKGDLWKALQRVNTGAFYLQGKFYDFAGRLTKSAYLSTNASVIMQKIEFDGPIYGPFELIGFLTLLKQAIKLFRALVHYWKGRRKSLSLSLLRNNIEKIYAEAYKTFKQTFMRKRNDPLCSHRPLENSRALDFSSHHSKRMRQCILCLTNINKATTTSCGHVYCWDCIISYCINVKPPSLPLCPLCRKIIRPQHLALLTNYT